MGARTARITTEDFLIPPEFRAYRLAEHSSGQVGGVSLAFSDEQGRARLCGSYQQVPLRAFPPFHFVGEPAALVYLINPTAGLMDGDGHLIDLDIGPGVTAVITGQSATRVHPALASFATQQWRVRVAAGARLVILPGPNIPFRGCRYHQRAVIDLAPDAQLIWGDIWLPGRYERNQLSERYAFDQIVQELEIRRDHVPIHRDRFHWRGPWNAAATHWHFGEGETAASAGMFVTGRVVHEVPSRFHRAILPLDSGDTLIRWCAPAAELAREVVTTALQLAGAWTNPSDPKAWLLASNHLGPTHWFSTL